MACAPQAVNERSLPERMSESVIRTSCHDVYQLTEQSGNGSSKHCGEPHWFIRQERIDLSSEPDSVSRTAFRILRVKESSLIVFFLLFYCFCFFGMFSKRLGLPPVDFETCWVNMRCASLPSLPTSRLQLLSPSRKTLCFF